MLFLLKILVVGTFFVPLVVLPSSFIFPFIVPKIIIFRTLVLLMAGIYIMLLASNWSEYKIRFSPVNLFIGLFFVSFLISTFVGEDWYRSFWDNHERMLGLFTITHYIVYYFILTSFVKEWKEWKVLFRMFLGAGMIVMFIGLLQKFDTDLIMNRGPRSASTLGNSIYFSGYGLFLLFIGFLLAVKERVKKHNMWFWFAVVGALFGFLGIFWGGARGALVGLGVGLLVLVAVYMSNLKIRSYTKIRRVLEIVMILGILLVGTMFIYRTSDFVQNIPAVGRLLNTEISSTNTRVMAWGIAVDAWKEKPVFGWGPNNYYYAFNKYYRAEFLQHGWGETWFDNAHSVIMNTLAVQGGFGIFTYLGIYITAITILWRGYKKEYFDIHTLGVGAAFLVAHIVSLATVFDNPTSYLYFFFFLAFLNSQYSNKGKEGGVKDSKEKQSGKISLGLFIATMSVIGLFIYGTNINPARANNHTLTVLKQLSNPNVNILDKYTEASHIPTPHIDDIRNDFSRTITNVAVSYARNNQTEKAEEFLMFALGELEKNRKLHPMDIRVHIAEAQIMMTLGQLTRDVDWFVREESLLEEALVYSPNRQQILYMLSTLKSQFSKFDEAEKLLFRAREGDSAIGETWWRLAILYRQRGDVESSEKVLSEAYEVGVNFTQTDLANIEKLRKIEPNKVLESYGN